MPNANLAGIFGCPEADGPADAGELTAAALAHPRGTPPLRELAAGRKKVLVVTDDVSRPTPVHILLPPLLRALKQAGVEDSSIEFLMALGTHRFMTREEMSRKLGPGIVERYAVSNHDWKDRDACKFVGSTPQGAEVWVNRKVFEADLVIGIGRIMPIDICGFTGGGKILIPGVCGEVTNSDMHWTRLGVPDEDVVGRRDNPIRQAIDEMARKAGLDFIINVVMDSAQRIAAVVTGDMVEAHRKGCEAARCLHEVKVPCPADIVIADGYPFDNEFWQVNKALDTAGRAVRKGGVVIVVSPCYEGFSATHPEIPRLGYRAVADVIGMVESGVIKDKVVGVHMVQVGKVAKEKASVILVTTGISAEDVRKAGLLHAPTPSAALDTAFAMLGSDARVVVLRNAAEMLVRGTVDEGVKE